MHTHSYTPCTHEPFPHCGPYCRPCPSITEVLALETVSPSCVWVSDEEQLQTVLPGAPTAEALLRCPHVVGDADCSELHRRALRAAVCEAIPHLLQVSAPPQAHVESGGGAVAAVFCFAEIVSGCGGQAGLELIT